MLSQFQSSRRSRILSLLVAIVVLAITVVSILPHYLRGEWVWNQPAQVPNLEQLRQLQQDGLTLPTWQTRQQKVVAISGHKWSIQELVPDRESTPLPEPSVRSPILLMLRPQTWHTDQPQVEWMDIDGVHGWTVDQRQRLRVAVNVPGESGGDRPTVINARFFRGWNQQKTYAVVQWYAWSTGGSFAPSRWFWADQGSRWRNRRRMPWVAVSLLIPIQPLGEIEQSRSIAETLAHVVQSSLMANALTLNREFGRLSN